MPVLNRKPISVDNDAKYHIKLIYRQSKNNMNNDVSQVFVYADFSFCWINCSKLIFSGPEL